MVKPLESQSRSRSLCAERTLLEGVARALMAATGATGCLFQLGESARQYAFGRPYEERPATEWPRLGGAASFEGEAASGMCAFALAEPEAAPIGHALLGPGIVAGRAPQAEALCRQQAHFIAAALGGCLERPIPFDALGQRELELKALCSLAASALDSSSVERVLETALGTVLSFSGLDAGLLIYQGAGEACPRLVASEGAALLLDPLGAFVRSRGLEALYRGLAGEEAETSELVSLREDLAARSLGWVVMPLQRHEQLLGLLLLLPSEGGAFLDELSPLLATLTHQVVSALERTTAYASLEQQVERRTAELRESHLRLESMFAELQRMDQFKANFLSNVSHELRTPLSGIIGYGEFLSDEVYGELNDEQKRVLEQMVANSYHLLELINNLLDLSRIDAGKLQLYLEPIELRTLLMQAAGKVAPQAQQKGIRLVLPDAREPLVEVDPGRIVQVLVNLLSNAIKFTPEAGTVEVKVSHDETTATVVVRDTGIGIPAEHLPKLFVRFSQGDASSTRRFGGTGLGLAISRELIELHGQRIWVESQPNVGSSFAFTLPLWQAEPELR